MTLIPKGFEYYYDSRWWEGTSREYPETERPTWGWYIFGNGAAAETFGAGAGKKILFFANGGLAYTFPDLIGRVDFDLSKDLTGWSLEWVFGTEQRYWQHDAWNPPGLHASDPDWAPSNMAGIMVGNTDDEAGTKGIAYEASIILVRGGGFQYCLAWEYALSIIDSFDLVVLDYPNTIYDYVLAYELVARPFYQSGWPDPYPLQVSSDAEAIAQIVAAGKPVICPVYQGPDASNHLGLVPGVIGVGGTGYYFTKTFPDGRHIWSGYGDRVSLVAPGAGIQSLANPAEGSWPTGLTSAATAFVAAQFLILQERYPDTSVENLYEIAKATAINGTTYYNDFKPGDPQTIRDDWHGYGFMSLEGPVEWDSEPEIRAKDITWNATLESSLEVPFYSGLNWSMSITIGQIVPTKILQNILFQMQASSSADFSVIWRSILKILNNLSVDGTLSLKNSLNLNLSSDMQLLNDLLLKLESCFNIKLTIEDLIRIHSDIRLRNTLLKESSVFFGDYHFDEGYGI
uniref:Putative peptidase n=1 Tax=viral metagenome TaxID=1070528 RepID=A0A6M3KH88_9ZZZZ